LLEAFDFCGPPFEVHLEVLAIDDTSLLLEALVDLLKLFSVLLQFALIVLLVVQLLVQLNQLDLLDPVLLIYVLKLFSSMRQDNHGLGDLLSKFVKFFVSLLNFFIQGLILNLELFEIDQMETISELLFLFEDLLFVGKLVSQSNILKSILMHFLVLK
jgi:hypothetical protein